MAWWREAARNDTWQWGVDPATTNRISCHNRHYAERAGYWLQTDFFSSPETKQAWMEALQVLATYLGSEFERAQDRRQMHAVFDRMGDASPESTHASKKSVKSAKSTT